MTRFAIVIVACFVLIACSSKQSRYKIEQDVEPSGEFDASDVPLVEPRWEPLSRQGNASSYEVRGKTYQVLGSEALYEEEGYASWYGLKFHGELTSNGEIYDMYSFSAAHKSLPLPSYVRVTNLENQRQLIVRINDRGPFHSDRIIDLSYAAAIKLGFKDKGTARVRLERLIIPSVKKTTSQSIQSKSPEAVEDRLALFIQLAAFSSYDLAEAMRERAETVLGGEAVFLADTETERGLLYRVRVGPFASEESAKKAVMLLTSEEIGKPQIITRSIKAPDA